MADEIISGDVSYNAGTNISESEKFVYATDGMHVNERYLPSPSPPRGNSVELGQPKQGNTTNKIHNEDETFVDATDGMQVDERQQPVEPCQPKHGDITNKDHNDETFVDETDEMQEDERQQPSPSLPHANNLEPCQPKQDDTTNKDHNEDETFVDATDDMQVDHGHQSTASLPRANSVEPGQPKQSDTTSNDHNEDETFVDATDETQADQRYQPSASLPHANSVEPCQPKQSDVTNKDLNEDETYVNATDSTYTQADQRHQPPASLPGANSVEPGQPMQGDITNKDHNEGEVWRENLHVTDLSDEYVTGYVDSVEDFGKLWESFRRSSVTTFSVRSSKKYFSEESDGTVTIHSKPRWSCGEQLRYDGTPLFVVENKTLFCHYGPKYWSETDRKEEKSQSVGDDGSHSKGPKRKRMKIKTDRRLNCPAEVTIQEIWKVKKASLTTEETKLSTRELKLTKKQKLQSCIELVRDKENVTKRFYIKLPRLAAHRGHAVLTELAASSQRLHPLVIAKIHELVGKGHTKVQNVKKQLREFVDSDLQAVSTVPIEPSDRAYHPIKKDLANHIDIALTKAKQKFGVTDQDIL